MMRCILLLSCCLIGLLLALNPVAAATPDTSIAGSAGSAANQEQEKLKFEQNKLALLKDQLQIERRKVTRDALKDWSEIVQAAVTAISILIVGWWSYRRFGWAQERYPNIEFTADIDLAGAHQDAMIVELIAYIENKGKVQHKMTQFTFSLDGLFEEDPVNVAEKWGGQVDFPRAIARGSFLPSTMNYFFVDPGTKAKYSWVARVPIETRFLLLHCGFRYLKRHDTGHTAERSIKIPDRLQLNSI